MINELFLKLNAMMLMYFEELTTSILLDYFYHTNCYIYRFGDPNNTSKNVKYQFIKSHLKYSRNGSTSI